MGLPRRGRVSPEKSASRTDDAQAPRALGVQTTSKHEEMT